MLKNNNKRVTTYKKSTLHKSIKSEYNKLLTENKSSVHFPKQFTSDVNIESAKYELVLVRDKLPGDEDIPQYDDYGILINKINDFPFTILENNTFFIEETFYIYGITQRFNFLQILSVLLLKGIDNKILKDIFVAHNKIGILGSDNSFHMIICKNEKDSIRLYKQLKEATIHLTKSILFLGNNSLTISEMYQIIKENTDWTIQKIRRLTTRP